MFKMLEVAKRAPIFEPEDLDFTPGFMVYYLDDV